MHEDYNIACKLCQVHISLPTIFAIGFTLYIKYLADKQGIAPEKVEIIHFSIEYVSAFAEYLEKDRSCGASTINLRLATIKSFLRYALVEAPDYTDTIRKSLSLPSRKTDQPVITFITKNEYESLLGACNGDSFISMRDKFKNDIRIEELKI